MKRNTKAIVEAFNAAFVAFLASRGVMPVRPLSYHEETPEFEIETRGGLYTFHHYPTLKSSTGRPLNFVGVHGRFCDVEKARKVVDCNPYSGKYNFDGLGHFESEDIAAAHANSIARQILRLA